MAGMLPGVEFARRRRLHQSGGAWSDPPPTAAYGSARRCSLPLCSRNHEPHHRCSRSYFRGMISRGCEDERLGGAAREAKERLDEKLRTQGMKSECRRSNAADGRRTGEQEGDARLRREAVSGGEGPKKGGSKRFSWGKLRWKAVDQEECAVCLDSFRAGENLMHLPCAHRFHSGCLVPWLESHSHCPCCRMAVSSS